MWQLAESVLLRLLVTVAKRSVGCVKNMGVRNARDVLLIEIQKHGAG